MLFETRVFLQACLESDSIPNGLRVAPLAIFESEIYGSWSTQR